MQKQAWVQAEPSRIGQYMTDGRAWSQEPIRTQGLTQGPEQQSLDPSNGPRRMQIRLPPIAPIVWGSGMRVG